jgi:hypothetical protein
LIALLGLSTTEALKISNDDNNEPKKEEEKKNGALVETGYELV